MDDALWRPAPHPALGAWREAAPDGTALLRWRVNPAAQRWGAQAGVREADWQRWAAACLAALEDDDGAPLPPGAVRSLPGGPALQAALCPQGADAVLAWLQPQAEAQARHELERLALAVQAAGLGVWESDLDGRTLYWNDAMYRLRGLDPADPRPVWQLSRLSNHPDDQRDLDTLPRRHLQQGVPYDRDLRVRWPDGSEHWLATRGRALAGAPGEPLRMVGVNTDITDRMRAQAAEIERERAEQASRAKSALLARVSHELRTPLNAVLGFAQLLLMPGAEPLSAAQRGRVQRIGDAGQHLLTLIDDLLDLARTDTEPPARMRVALAPLVEEALQWCAAQAQQADVAVDAEPVDAALAVWGDARRVRQVLLNLVSNAIKYNRRGGRVDLGAWRSPDGGRAGLWVRDCGHGLTVQQLQQLGEAFNRLGAEQRGIEGTGIGLAISRELLQRMDGWLEVHSTPGQGSCFGFWLAAA